MLYHDGVIIKIKINLGLNIHFLCDSCLEYSFCPSPAGGELRAIPDSIWKKYFAFLHNTTLNIPTDTFTCTPEYTGWLSDRTAIYSFHPHTGACRVFSREIVFGVETPSTSSTLPTCGQIQHSWLYRQFKPLLEEVEQL